MRRYRPLLLILALLLMPFAIGAGLYAWGWHPDQPGNHGELLSPPRALPPLADAAGQPIGEQDFDGHWSLVVAGPGPCDTACRNWIVATRQIHVALYKQMPRVQRTWLSDQTTPDITPLQALQPDLHAAVARSAAARTAFDLDNRGHRVYVVDPLGKIILRYAPDADPRGILKDMERLLRYAWAG
jgi:cytochrome oxidase Cu insertion factor (SCO1/SenC/PrrC family)